MHIFSGIYKGRKIFPPNGLKTRPTSGRLREALFNICQGEVEGISFLDLFAGSGAMGFEALSRGAAHVTFIDNSRESLRSIRVTAANLDVTSKVTLHYGDVFTMLMQLSKKKRLYDIIYADPPYEYLIQCVGQALTYSGNVLKIVDELCPSLLSETGSLFLEDAYEGLPKPNQFSLQHLSLQSSREMGRAGLQHYRRMKVEG